jgi:parallel beta-helix repeat protein
MFLSPRGDSFINITSDDDFLAYASYGNGTQENPFVIEDKLINDEQTKAISITNTSKYFIVRNCYLADNHDYGIFIDDIANGTAQLINNIIINHGISGISLRNSDNIIVTNNSIIENYNGIELINSDNNTIQFNSLTENNFGINFISNSCLNSIIMNSLENSTSWGLSLYSFSNNNTIHHNNFLNNNFGGLCQAYDNSSFNLWYEQLATEGNYWDNLVNSTYSIAGSANSTDLYPLADPVQIFTT